MIYREQHTVNYTVVSNSLINTKLPSDAKNVLTWLLSKPKNWKLIKVVIAEALGLSKHRVQQAITILRNLGYLCFYRHQDGSGHWDVYETPRPQNQAQTRVVKPSPSMPTKAFQTDLTSTDSQKILKTTTAESIPDQKGPVEADVVVNFENEQIHNPIHQLEEIAPAIKTPESATVPDTQITADPVIVTEVEKLAVTQSIKPTLIKTLAALTLAEAKAVLNILARAIVLGKIQNPVGYAIELSKRAQNGTLTPIQANYQPTLSERMAKQEARFKAESERGKVTNEQWVAMMAARGIKVQI